MSESSQWHWFLLPGDRVEHYDGRRAIFRHRISATEVFVRTEGNAGEAWDVSLFAPVDPGIVCAERADWAEQARQEGER